jgi:cyclopropane fatty-acyl-phospholipid synthase-like methyltransferase
MLQFICFISATGADIEQRLRTKVKDVLSCDIHLANPLHPHPPEQFDVIVAFLVMEASCPTEASYKQAAKNVTSLLKPGGRVILLSVLYNQGYTFNQHVYDNLYVTQEFVKEAFEDAGIENITFKTRRNVLDNKDQLVSASSSHACLYFMHGMKSL